MSADQVHHQIELAMKRKVKIYDFEDFEEAVASINNSKVVVKSMKPENFINVLNIVSDRRIQNSTPQSVFENYGRSMFQSK